MKIDTDEIARIGGIEFGRNPDIAAALTTLRINGLLLDEAKPKIDQAVDMPMDDCGLHINTGRDGTWLHFSASTGRAASLNVEALAAQRGHVLAGALIDWCDDRRKQADDIKQDNSQFGVGA